MMDHREEADLRILITGASAGIGEACARRFAAEGAELILWARRLDRLDRLADELEQQHGRHAHAAAVDVRDRDGVLSAVDALVEAGAVPDVLVNNAGLASGLAGSGWARSAAGCWWRGRTGC